MVVCALRLPPAVSGSGVRCGRACWGLGFGCAPPLLGGLLGCVCARAPVPRGLLHLLVGVAVRGCVFVRAPRLFPTFPGWGGVCGRACWARVSAVPRPSWLGCVFCAFFFACLGWALWCRLLAVPVLGLVVPVPPSPFFRAGLLARFFFPCGLPPCFGVLFPGGPLFLAWCCQFWLGGPPVPLWGSCLRCLLGGGFGPLLRCWGAVWWLWAVLSPPPPSPPFFFGGGACLFLPLPSLGWRTHWPAFSVVFRAAVGGCVLLGRVPAPWVGWAMYTLGLAPLPAGLGPGSAGWAAAPGGCVWLWVRGLELSVFLLLCGAGFNLLGGPPPLLPGARWPRVWPAVPVCGVLVRRLPGCAVACFGYSFRLWSVVPCCAALCRVASRRAVARCTVARCVAVCRGLALCRGGSVEVSLACVVVRSAGRSVAGWWLGGLVRCGCFAGSVLWGPGRATRAGASGRRQWGCPPWGSVPWSRVL